MGQWLGQVMFGYGYYGTEIFKERNNMTTFTTEDRLAVRPLQDRITAWIRDYAQQAGMKSLVVGISGGIDSAVVSALCARTGLHTVAVTMPIRQRPDLHDLSMRQGAWLCNEFDNVRHEIINLTSTFDEFERRLSTYNNLLGFANSRSRLRMVTLYQIAQSVGGLVVGTGNKVEDFGVGFYTKYGDGGVDISPIADCYKTEVWAMGRELGVLQDIIDAAPTDGLWDDGRTDEDQLGLTYADLEVAMRMDLGEIQSTVPELVENLKKFRAIQARSLHKMNPIPVFKK
jgi:NAD+ synthase